MTQTAFSRGVSLQSLGRNSQMLKQGEWVMGISAQPGSCGPIGFPHVWRPVRDEHGPESCGLMTFLQLGFTVGRASRRETSMAEILLVVPLNATLEKPARPVVFRPVRRLQPFVPCVLFVEIGTSSSLRSFCFSAG